MYARVYVCMCVHLCIYACVHVWMCACEYMCACVCVEEDTMVGKLSRIEEMTQDLRTSMQHSVLDVRPFASPS